MHVSYSITPTSVKHLNVHNHKKDVLFLSNFREKKLLFHMSLNNFINLFNFCLWVYASMYACLCVQCLQKKGVRFTRTIYRRL